MGIQMTKKKSNSKKLLKKNIRKSQKKNTKTEGGERLNLRCTNMDCGPPFHPIWNGPPSSDGPPPPGLPDSKNVALKGGNKKKKNQKGGDGQGNQGHDVSMPIQYFGKQLNRYFPTGSPELIAPNSAYGPTIATNMGVSIPGNNKFVGPDLGAFNKSIGIS